ncbi:hypothetical protein TorRG33x02_344670 [Trema orientale]|uniref:Uncharacterized protein n=1 Tax=Trema orientale TaxID=63057 RepID=A0A2P5APZ9_TREOI|nr:hypothetical protein TorRG33x02_344670 [Trema orientale]
MAVLSNEIIGDLSPKVRKFSTVVELVRPPLPVVSIVFNQWPENFDPGRIFLTGIEPPFDRSRTIRLESKLPVEIFDQRSTVVEKFRPQSNIASRLLGAASITFDFFDLFENFRLGSSQG